MAGMDLSVVIVTYNSHEMIRHCLGSLPSAAQGLRWEAIVVDNHSHDGTPQLVEREFPDVRLISGEENVGFGGACNQGFQVSCGQSILCLNDDTQLHPGTLATLVGYLRGHPRVGGLGPRLRRPDGRPSRSCFRFPSLTHPYLNQPLVKRLVGEHFALAYPFEDARVREGGQVDWLSGACLLLRKEAVDAVGLFDARYFMYFEDIDLCRRLWNSGWEVVYYPHVEVIHVGGATSSRYEARSAFEDYRSRLIYFSTHHPGLVAWLQRWMIGFAAVAHGACWLVKCRMGRVRVALRILWLAVRGVNG